MKRITLLLTLCLLAFAAMAQPGEKQKKSHTKGNLPTVISSENGESFYVEMNDRMQNMRPQSYVMVSDFGPYSEREVTILMKQPKGLTLLATIRKGQEYVLFLDQHDNTYRLLTKEEREHYRHDHQHHASTPSHNPVHGAVHPEHNSHAQHVHPVPTPEPIAILPTTNEVKEMVDRLKRCSFDDDRLNLARGFAKRHMESGQIGQLARTFSFDDNRLVFLKMAYADCIDKENYFRLTDHLTFSDNRNALLKYISQ